MRKKPGDELRVAACAAILSAAAPGVANDDVGGHMQEHYEAVVELQRAVIAGSLDDAREPARWLAEHSPPPGLAPGSDAHVDAMRAAANDTLNATDVVDVASATAKLGIACGGCHSANDVTIEFDEEKRPSDKDKRKSHMQRHEWAAARMWDGLIGPSDYSWSRGANLLFESPLRSDSLGNEGDTDSLTGMARRIHQLAANATTVSDPKGRAEVYAEFLANCASCHAEIGKGPR